MFKEFYNPPTVLLASGDKTGVELGGSKILVSIDENHHFHSEGNIYTEVSWGEFYQEEGLEDQIDTFTTRDYSSIREDPEALKNEIIRTLRQIMQEKRLFYGIIDFECDAFMNMNVVIPGLSLEPTTINKLMESHKKNRDEENFPKLAEETSKIDISIQGTKKEKVLFPGKSLSDYADQLRLARGFATGIVVTSKKAANFFLMNDTIVFEEALEPEFYIDQDCIWVIESGIERDKLFPVSWFRVDIGLLSLETLDMWQDIKDDDELIQVISEYEKYLSRLIVKKYKEIAPKTVIDELIEKDMDLIERRKAMNELKAAINRLSDKI